MNPRHRGIDTLDEYAYWVDQTIHERGGMLDHGYVDVEEVVDDRVEVVGRLYRRQWFRLVHGFPVGFDKFVDAHLTVVEHHYRYAATDGRLFVELHNHCGHERDVGSRLQRPRRRLSAQSRGFALSLKPRSADDLCSRADRRVRLGICGRG